MERDVSIVEPTAGPAPVVVFDLGGVLVDPTDLVADLAAVAGTSVEALGPAYWRHRDALDMGGDPGRYWRAVLVEAGVDASDASEELVGELGAADTTAWTTVLPAAEQLLIALRGAGVRVAVLSNAGVDIAERAPRTGWAEHVDAWYFSSAVGLGKPDPAIFAHVTADLGVAAPSVVFFDDRATNVEAARAFGWSAQVWTSATAAADSLGELGVLGGTA